MLNCFCSVYVIKPMYCRGISLVHKVFRNLQLSNRVKYVQICYNIPGVL